MRCAPQFAVIALVQVSLWHGAVQAFAADGSAVADQLETPQIFTNSTVRGLPADQYAKLRATAVAGASVRVALTIKNPMAETVGLSSGTLAVLQQQRAYLRAHALSLEQAIAGSAPGMSTFPRGMLMGSTDSRREESLLSRRFEPYCAVPVIVAVNGQTNTPVFTPQLPDNHYRIEGCGFGMVAGEVRLEPDANLSAFGLQPRPIELPLDSPAAWNDNEVDVHLDSRLWGIPDWPVTLVLRSASGAITRLPGCRFIAVRGQPTLLPMIAASWVKLDATTVLSHPISQLELMSPPSGNHGLKSGSDATTSLVVRSDENSFPGGTDHYDFSHLNPGWVVASVQLNNYSVTCLGEVTSVTNSGQWNVTFAPQGFNIAWASSFCSSFLAPEFEFYLGFSEYAIKVWVVGPAGTQPTQAQF